MKLPSAPDISWQEIVARYSKPDSRRAIVQIANSLLPYLGLWVLMILSLKVSWWLTLGLSVIAAGFLIRVFIISHDCGHGSFFKSRTANDILGFITGMLAFTPYHYWTHQHAIHHATAGNLDKRGTGDVWTMTVREYRESGFWTRMGFRLYRHPLVMFFLGPIYMFLIKHRFADLDAGRRWHLSVLWSNLAMLGTALAVIAVIGLKAFLMIQLPTILIAAVGGVWLFYVQHQFEGVYWAHQEDWDYVETALRGSSHYDLPRILQWFSGNIGFHHIHHLSPRIPNYFLDKCHRENVMFQRVKSLRFIESFKCLRYRLWDEDRSKLVGWGAVRQGS